MRSKSARSLGFALPLLAVSASLPAHGAIFKVGPGGTHPSLQAAIQAANATPGEDQIRIRVGTHATTVEAVVQPGGILISGGWNATFSSATNDATKTILDGKNLDNVLSLQGGDGSHVFLRAVTLKRGSGGEDGGGGLLAFFDGGSLTVENCRVSGNRSELGGGIVVEVAGTAAFALRDSVVSDNRAEGLFPADGGASLSAFGEATLVVERNRITGNRVTSNDDRGAGGITVHVGELAAGRVTDNEVSGNLLFGSGLGYANAAQLSAEDNGLLEVRRNRFVGNLDTNPETNRLVLTASDASRIKFSDSVVAQSGPEGVGVLAVVLDTAQVHLTNLTVVAAGELGVLVDEAPGSTGTLFNSIVHGNATATHFVGAVANGNNLIAGDPKFVDVAQGNYRLKTGSPAGNKGKQAPPGGLGPTDVERKPRVKTGKVDIGAYESL
jgi:hypothetical protein